MVYQIPHYIQGQKRFDEQALTGDVFDSSTGERLATVAFASEALCEETVNVAKKAAQSWSASTLVKRTKILFKFRELLEKDRDHLALLVSKEHGKTIDDAKGSVDRAIEVVEYNCGLLNHLQGKISINLSSDIDCHTILQPLGVCAGVSPFNFPVMVPVWMMVPAVSCGNSFILKPSEQDPSSVVRLMELFSDAGLPEGVVNCLNGDKSTVDYLIHHPDIASMTAVASTPVAEYIYTSATASGKRAHTFGGAKNHCLVMPDADMAFAAKSIVGAAFGSAGERCMALSVLVAVGDACADEIIQSMNPHIKAMRIGSGQAAETDIGPLISSAHRARVLDAVHQGVEEGARLIVDGRNFKHPTCPEGYYLGPCLFDEVQESMSIYQNEIFGPVLAVVRVKNFEEGLALINRNQYGNGSAIFTRDGYTAREYSHQVQAGMVGINVPVPVPIASHPFGGWKRSVFGDTNMHGSESINFYTRRKSITARWPVSDLNESIYTMPSHQ